MSYTPGASLLCGRYIKKGQFAIIGSLTEDTLRSWRYVGDWRSALCRTVTKEHSLINSIMNYYDGREHFGAYDMLLRFYGCWKEQKYDALMLHVVHAVHIAIVWGTAPSYF